MTAGTFNTFRLCTENLQWYSTQRTIEALTNMVKGSINKSLFLMYTQNKSFCSAKEELLPAALYIT